MGKKREWCTNQDPVEAKAQSKFIRCPRCNRRLHPKASYTAEGGLKGYTVPRHKEK